MYKERIEREPILQNQKKIIQESGKNSSLEKFLQSMVEMISGIENYESPYKREDGLAHSNPEKIVEEITKSAAWKAGTISATCSLPAGGLGFLTLLPELVMIFRIQGCLVKDIASIYGKSAELTRELLLFSLFKNGGAHLFRKFIEETGVKIMIRPTTVRAFQALLQKLGLDISRRVLRKNFSRWVPLAGAAITGSFAYFDTQAVGRNAQSIFSKEIVILLEDSNFSIEDSHLDSKKIQLDEKSSFSEDDFPHPDRPSFSEGDFPREDSSSETGEKI